MAASESSGKRWFHPNISGQEAERLLLEEGEVGSFLMRPSQSMEGDYSLSVRQKNGVTHLKIQNTGDHYDLYGGDTFASSAELVQYYMEGRGVLKETNGSIIELKYPLYSSDPKTERWYHGSITSAAAQALLQSEPPGSFLVRESQTQPGDFVLSVHSDEDLNCNSTHIMITHKDGKYEIGDGNKFISLTKLIEYFKAHEIRERFGSVVHLKTAVNRTLLKARDIGIRVEQLSKPVTINGLDKDGFWEEFEQLQHQETTDSYLLSRTEGQRPENKQKNRYKNILPFDKTRFVLKDGDPQVVGSDYINANVVSAQICRGVTKQYIATQGCLQSTLADFWRMVWQSRSSIIVMTTKTVENGKNKCVQYWPEEGESPRVFDVYQGQIIVKIVKTTPKDNCTIRLFEVSRTKLKKGETGNGKPVGDSRLVHHYHFTIWPDKKVPDDARPVLDFLSDVNEREAVLGNSAPIIVHCSAGIGRTGTYIVLDVIINQIKREELNCEINIPKTIMLMRGQRSGIVQTDAQFKFVYLAIKEFIQLYMRTPQQGASPVYANTELIAPIGGVRSTQRSPTRHMQEVPRSLTGGVHGAPRSPNGAGQEAPRFLPAPRITPAPHQIYANLDTVTTTFRLPPPPSGREQPVKPNKSVPSLPPGGKKQTKK